MLLNAQTLRAAAETLKINESTLYKWLKDEKFKKAYLGAKRQAVEAAIGRLQKLSEETVDVFQQIMNDQQAPASARIAAAKAVLEFAFKGILIEDLEERITELEGRAIKK